MSKKDYEMIAYIIANMKIVDGMSSTAHTTLAVEFMRKLSEENPSFDKKRFLRACAVEWHGWMAEA